MHPSLLLVPFLFAACHCPSGAAGGMAHADRATCTVVPTQGNQANGTVDFTAAEGGVRVVAQIRGLNPGQKHGFHVHEYAFGGSADATCTGGHFDPAQSGVHALPGSPGAHHAGDLGNLVADQNGVARYDAVIQGLQLTGQHGIIGRAIIVHAKPDDGGQPTGNAGGRIGVGTIGVAGPMHAGH